MEIFEAVATAANADGGRGRGSRAGCITKHNGFSMQLFISYLLKLIALSNKTFQRFEL